MQKTVQVVKDESYHKSAVYYNEEVQKAIEAIAEKIEHPVPRKWALSVARQHKYHAGRHRRALRKIQKESEQTVVATEDSGEDTAQSTVEAPPAAAEGVDASPDPTMAAKPVDAGVDTAELDARIDQLHGPGAAAAIEAAYADGSIDGGPRELTAQEQADLAQAQADAAASKNGEANE